MPVDGAGADRAVQSWHRLDVVGEDVGSGGEHNLQSFCGAAEVGRQDLHGASRNSGLHCADYRREMGGAAVGKIVPVHRSDHDVGQAHPFHCLGQVGRLFGVHAAGRAGHHGAEAAAPRAHIPQDHESGRPLAPALIDVGAGGLLADGVQVQCLHGPPHRLVASLRSAARAATSDAPETAGA